MIYGMESISVQCTQCGERQGGKTTLTAQVVRSLCKKGLKGVYVDVEKGIQPQSDRVFRT